MDVDYAAVWQKIITGADHKSWAVFQNGTAVIFTEPETDLASQATALMKEWGRVHVGSPAGDFTTIKLKDLLVASPGLDARTTDHLPAHGQDDHVTQHQGNARPPYRRCYPPRFEIAAIYTKENS